MQDTTTTSNSENKPSASATPPAADQVPNTTNNPGNPSPAPVVSPATPQETTPTSSLGKPSSTPATSPAADQGKATTANLGNPSPAPTPSPHQPQQTSTMTTSGASAAVSAATSSVAQQKTVPPASSGSSAATTAVTPVPTHTSGSPTTPGGLATAVRTDPSVGAQGRQPVSQLTSAAATTGVPTSSHAPGLKNHSVSSPTSVTKQPQSSPGSPDQGLTSSTTPGSMKTSVTPFDGSVSPTASNASASSSPGSIHKVSEATTPTLEADQRRPAFVPTKPTSTDPARAQPSAQAPGDQTASSCPGHQHPTRWTSSQNEVICEDQVQNNWPMIYLKEAKSCAEWRTASMNISFFESFCSTGQHAFNASRDTCTVMLTSHEPYSQQWAMRAMVHFPLDPENVFKELKEKDKLEELGIANTTYDKLEREMVINDEFSTPLIITIVTLAGSLLLIAAIYGCCHQRFSQKKDQHIHPDVPGFDDGHVALIFNQRLTEELQTMENGYHDNPTLEVMETSSEMQEKKVNLNGELGDSWIVPLDTLMKEDLEEEEDTHL
ncbi:PREDICTED: podocalyxin isoform X1 [Calidris pugnax]|uniref:podocalyxin isoform X1 n=1 Tax=Calidris pugnax TaxID=198806 RepID=UPI00071DAFC1|nr:PREDICTED: podocalyxin isoform X1 [Calidris pugnax]